jgi:hypothetical protein
MDTSRGVSIKYPVIDTTSATSPASDVTPAISSAIPENISSDRGEGFADLYTQLVSAYSSEEEHSPFDRHRMELSVEWEVPQALRLYKRGTRFSSILAISGNEIDAQAATCKDYLQEHFKTGQTLLHAVQATWDTKTLYNTEPPEGNLRHLSVKLSDLERQTVVVTASGTSSSLTEVASAFAWLCCALRPALSEHLSFSTFQFDFHATTNQSCSNVVVKLQLLRKTAGDRSSCWHHLFKKANIILDGPISDRSRFEQSKGNQKGMLPYQN